MKKLFLILFLFSSSETFAQTKLRGDYQTYWGRSGTRISFTEDGKFDFHRRGCRRLIGQGAYSIEKDTLMLNFLCDSTLKSSHMVADRSEALVNTHGILSDRVMFSFNVADKISHKPMSFVSVDIVVNSKDTLTAVTDWNGNAILNVKKQPGEVEINLDSYLYEDYTFKLKPERSRSIYVEMAQAFSSRLEDEPAWKFKIIKNNPDGIELRDAEDSSDDDNFYFEKQTALSPGDNYPEVENIDRFCRFVDDYQRHILREEEKRKAITDKKDTWDLFYTSNEAGDTIYSIDKNTEKDIEKEIFFYYKNNMLVKARIEYRSDVGKNKEKRFYYANYYFKDNKLIKSFFEKKKYSNAEDILAEGLRLQAAGFNDLKNQK